MLFIDAFPSGRSINAPAAFLLGLFVACVPARAAAQDCLSLSAARVRYPNVHLWWHYSADKRTRCWNDHGPTHRTPVVKYRGPQTPPVPAPRLTVIWPTLLASKANPVDVALYAAESASRWPSLIIDLDAEPPIVDDMGNQMSRDLPLPLDDPPFAERWRALPSNWYAQEIRR